jgi:hypothetical protein
MLNSIFSVIPDVYWLGNHKFLKTDGHFIARKWNNAQVENILFYF